MKTSKSSGGGRNVRSKPLPAMGAMPLQSALVGGVGNANSPPATKRGKVDSFNKGGIAESKPGGFRNQGMANRR